MHAPAHIICVGRHVGASVASAGPESITSGVNVGREAQPAATSVAKARAEKKLRTDKKVLGVSMRTEFIDLPYRGNDRFKRMRDYFSA